MTIAALSQQVVTLLARNESKLVLSESCTAGLIAASLGGIPGVSSYLCGSAVVYREQTKVDWLKVNPDTINTHTAVSAATSAEIAVGVLRQTPEADWSLGITGHLGPGSPTELDGRIFVACCHRSDGNIVVIGAAEHKLRTKSRLSRQQEAAEFGLQELVRHLDG